MQQNSVEALGYVRVNFSQIKAEYLHIPFFLMKTVMKSICHIILHQSCRCTKKGLKSESDAKTAESSQLWMGISYKINHIGFSFINPEKNN